MARGGILPNPLILLLNNEDSNIVKIRQKIRKFSLQT
jgi:hypothetical protein